MRYKRALANLLVSCLTFCAGAEALAYPLLQATKKDDSSLDFSFKMGGDTTFVSGTSPNASFGTSLDYALSKTYSIGAEYSFYQPYTQFDDYISNGANDLSLYLANNRLWHSRYYGITVSGKLGGTLPTSIWSQESSVYGIVSESLTIKKEFSDREYLSFTTSSMQYSVKYIEAYVDPQTGSTIYNTRIDWNNRLNYSLEFVKNWKWVLGGGMKYYNNYNDDGYFIYRLSTGLSAQVSKSASMDLTVTSNQKDENADKTWNGPATSSHFFDAKGTLIAFSMTIKI